MAIINGVGRVGIRSYVAAPQQITTSTLLNSLYSVWNADTLGTSLDTSIVGVWNAEGKNNISVKNAWNANGNANDSKGTANGTVATPSGTTFTTGTMTYGTGKLGSGAFTFDGTNFINLPDNTLSFTGDFSISCWFYVPANYVANGSLVSTFDNKSSYTTYYGWNFSYDSANKCIGFSIGNPAGGSYANVALSTPNNSIVPGQWNHVIVARKMSTRSSIYINGVLSASNTSTMNPTYNFGLSYIGAIFYAFSQPYYNKPNAGLKIDSIYTFEAELDAAAVSELYNSGTGQEYPFTISNALIATPKDNFGTNHGTLTNGCTFTTGKIGSAFAFDGVNDYVALPNNSLNSTIGTDFSVSLWVNFTSTANQTLISNMSSPSINYWSGWEIRLVSGQPTIYMWNNAATAVGAQGGVISTNTWYHIVATRKKGSRTRIYINGSLIQTDTNTPDPSINGTYYPNIGHLQYTSTFHALYMANGGKIDGLTIWAKELSSDEVTQLYNLGTGVQYPYSSQTLPSANNQFAIDNGTLMNGCSLTGGKIGKAFTFDGVNDYVALPDNSLNFVGDFTTSFWFYANTFAGQDSFVTCENWVAPNDNGWYIYHYQGNLAFSVYNGTNATGWKTSTTITTGTWYHVVVVKNRSVSPKFYINDTLVESVLRTGTDTTLNAGYVTTQYCSLGTDRYAASTAQAYFNGKMDGVNIWQREITQAEVTELYNSGTGKQLTIENPIIANGLALNLDASRKSSYPNTGAIWYDISGNGNNGTMVNGPIFGTANNGLIMFDGVNDYVNLGNKSSLTPGTSDFTISFWMNPSSFSSTYSPFFTTAITNGLWIGQISSNFVLRSYNVVDDIQYSVLPTLNVWTMITINRSSGIARIYYNDTMVASASNSRNYVSGNSYIGTDFVGSSNCINSKLSTFSYYNRALSATEITQNYNATKSRFGL